MTGSSWKGAVVRAARARSWIATLAALLGAGLLLGSVQARGAEKGAMQATAPVKVSPYLRYAREHAKAAAKVPPRVRPSSSTVHGARGGARVGRQ